MEDLEAPVDLEDVAGGAGRAAKSRESPVSMKINSKDCVFPRQTTLLEAVKYG